MINKATRSFKGVTFKGIRLHDKAFPDVDLGNGVIIPGTKVMCFSDEKGRDWYDEREDKVWGAVVATDANKIVCAMAADAMKFIPIAGYDIWEIHPDKVPSKDAMDVLGMYTYDGEAFEKL